MIEDPCGGDVPGGDGCRCDPTFAPPPETITLYRDDGGSPLDRLRPGMLVPLLTEDGELIQRFIVAAGDDGELRLIPDPFGGDGDVGE